MVIRDARIDLRAFALVSVTLFTLSGCLGGSGSNQVDARLGEAPVAYVLRQVPLDDDGVMLERDERDPVAFYPGANLIVRDAAAPAAAEVNLSARLFNAPHDIRDISPSYDGKSLLFSVRAPEIPGADEDDQPRWNIWEYRRDTDTLRRIISSNLIAEEGHDLMPTWLPDGRILFVSDRQRQSRARLLDEGKPQFAPQDETRQTNALALHVMNSDGSDIRQISFNPGHDLWPLVMADGRVLLVRWDNNGTRNQFNLYSMNPDGTRGGILYGANSHANGDPAPLYSAPRLLDDGRILLMKRPQQSAHWAGVPLIIDVASFINRTVPLGAVGGEAEESPLTLPVSVTDDISVSGRFAWVTSLGDGTGRLLAAWAPCRLRHPQSAELLACTQDNLNITAIEEAEPAYGLWIFDPRSDRQLPVVPPRDGVMVTEAVAMVARSFPAAVPDGVPGIDLDLALAERGAGVLNIRSVFDVDGRFQPPVTPPDGVTTLADFADPAQVRAAQRGVLFLRISKAVLIPDRDLVQVDGADIGRLPALGMREIVGYAPVSPDGSVRVEVPANVALDIELVDDRGRRLGARHGAWISVRPGEEYQCRGCHAGGSAQPHGRPDDGVASINAGAPVTGLPFPNTRPELFADAGDTLAEVLTRVEPEWRRPSLDVRFEDVWTDPALAGGPDVDFGYPYADLQTPAPATPECLAEWNPVCRSIIDYRTHIQPLWDLPRDIEVDGMPVTQACSDCHRRRDQADMLQVPPGQLELTADIAPEAASQLVSYRELLFPDNVLVLEDGALVDALEPVLDDQGQPVYQTDEEGNVIEDENGDPIPVLQTIPISAPLTAGTARTGRFFNRFASGASHEGWLTPAEMRLLYEWLDIGAQNYNDPFVVPQ